MIDKKLATIKELRVTKLFQLVSFDLLHNMFKFASLTMWLVVCKYISSNKNDEKIFSFNGVSSSR